MKKKPGFNWRSLFSKRSLRAQLLSRTLLLLAVLLVLIGLSQYWFMREVVYKNEASILENKAMAIPVRPVTILTRVLAMARKDRRSFLYPKPVWR